MITDPKKDPHRRCMPIAEWPVQDREAWDAAVRSGDPFEAAGLAAHWRPQTRRKVQKSYGRWLTFLDRHNDLGIGSLPQGRVTPTNLKRYVSELQNQLSPLTVCGRIIDLREALRVMVPGHKNDLLEHLQRILPARARPVRNKRARMVPSSVLFELGFTLMDEAENADALRSDWMSCRYRDGLMVAVLASRALRRDNLRTMRLGKNIDKIGERYVLFYDGAETKNHRPFEVTLPLSLTALIDRYLQVHRPVLLRSSNSDAFWISYLGRPMSYHSVYQKICSVTQQHLGIRLTPHLFRDCLATSQAIEDPNHVRSAAPILGHSDFQTTERFYIQAESVHASRAYQSAIEAIRKRLKSEQSMRALR